MIEGWCAALRGTIGADGLNHARCASRPADTDGVLPFEQGSREAMLAAWPLRSPRAPK
jgi:hypothetical protein